MIKASLVQICKKRSTAFPTTYLLLCVWSHNTCSHFYIFLPQKYREQGVELKDVKSPFRMLLSGVPQGSILVPVLFNIFLKDLFLFVTEAKLANFADSNTLYGVQKDTGKLLIK